MFYYINRKKDIKLISHFSIKRVSNSETCQDYIEVMVTDMLNFNIVT